MWLRVLISRKVAIYSDRDNIIIIIIIIGFLGLRFKLRFCVGITLVVPILCWLHWHFVGILLVVIPLLNVAGK